MKAKGVKTEKSFDYLKAHHIDQGIFHVSVRTPASRLFQSIIEAVRISLYIGIYR